MNDRPPSPGDTSDLSAAQVALELPRLIERMHRRFLDVLRLELNRIGIRDISPVQAMMISNIGDEEISVHELIERGYYLGSNASYNLKQVVEGGYVSRNISSRDRREARLTVTPKGKQILDAMAKMNTESAQPFMQDAADFAASWRLLRKLERRWSESVRLKGG